MNTNLIKNPNSLIGKEVYVYKNLNKKCLSVKDTDTNLVIAYTYHVHLLDSIFVVSEYGRQQVLATRHKNVHAGVKGILVSYDIIDLENATQVTYNPYKYSSFVRVDDLSPIYSCNECVVSWTGEIRVV